MIAFSKTTHISRLGKGWFLSFKGEDQLFNDDTYGGRRAALARAVLERYKLELLALADDYNWASQRPHFGRVKNKGDQQMPTGIWRQDERWLCASVALADNQNRALAMRVDEEFYGKETARWLIIYARHLYCHFFYGETYHEHRNDPGLNQITDQLLDTYGIPHTPDIPTLVEAAEPPEASLTLFDVPDKQPDKQRSRSLYIRDTQYDKETYDDFDIPRVQGVSYSPAKHSFYASLPDTNRAFRIIGRPEEAFRKALIYRHQFMVDTYGEEYHQHRNKPDNFHPSDEILERFGVPPEGIKQANP